MARQRETVVIGSGPNGLAAAIRMAQAGQGVTVYEAAGTPGGGLQSAALTLPGFVHDRFAAVFPVAAASPFFRTLPLAEHGLSWIEPSAPLAHPLDDGRTILLERSIERTAAGLRSDRDVYVALMRPLVEAHEALVADFLAPPGKQRKPRALVQFGQHAFRSAIGFASSYFHGDEARALLAGNAAHSFLPLEAPLTAGYGLFLALLGHAVGWPIVQGGAGNLSAALVSMLRALGGTVETEYPVRSLAALPEARATFFDTDPKQLAAIAGPALPLSFRSRLARHRYGPGIFKVDYALSEPVPWTAAECRQAATLHIGGSLEEIALAEREVNRGRHAEKPFIIVSQPSVFDRSRAPHGQHTLWAYCHVPAGSEIDMSERIERQIERFAPGFRDCIIARNAMGPRALQEANANLVGGAINGGVQDLRTYADWARARPSPYATPNPGIFRCSAATPPGGGVHGMAGFYAAEFALQRGKVQRV